MTNFKLSQEEILTLKRAHRAAKKKRDAYRINAIVLLGTGWTIREVAEIFLLDDEKYERIFTVIKWTDNFNTDSNTSMI